jgi:hypothetical protein
MGDYADLAPGAALFDVEFQGERNRLTTLVQPVVALPQALFVLVAEITLLVLLPYAWLVLAFTGRWPPRAFRWIVGWNRAYMRAWAYLNLVVGTYPPWSFDDEPEYPARLVFGPPKPLYSRGWVLLRLVHMIPAYCAGGLGGLLLIPLLALSWLHIVVTGRQSRQLFDAQRTCLAWFVHYSLIVTLVIEDYDWRLVGQPSYP